MIMKMRKRRKMLMGMKRKRLEETLKNKEVMRRKRVGMIKKKETVMTKLLTLRNLGKLNNRNRLLI